MFFLLRRWRRQRVLARTQLDSTAWAAAVAATPAVAALASDELARLRDLAVLFLHEKALEPAGDLVLDEAMRLRVAALACLPILNLGLDYYRDWYAVVLYPAGFVARHEEIDEAGAVHHVASPLVGEAWSQGPVILSWEDIEQAAVLDGYNVALHEFAHKLDMLAEGANGSPPLHAGMSPRQWREVFSAAYANFCARVDAGEETAIDPYARESPGEFFAVLTEVFFECPHLIDADYPAVYDQLRQFYRQDPISRLGGGAAG